MIILPFASGKKIPLKIPIEPWAPWFYNKKTVCTTKMSWTAHRLEPSRLSYADVRMYIVPSQQWCAVGYILKTNLILEPHPLRVLESRKLVNFQLKMRWRQNQDPCRQFSKEASTNQLYRIETIRQYTNGARIEQNHNHKVSFWQAINSRTHHIESWGGTPIFFGTSTLGDLIDFLRVMPCGMQGSTTSIWLHSFMPRDSKIVQT